MDEEKAKKIAKMIGGEPWQSGGNIWLVIVPQEKHVSVISEDSLCAYKDVASLIEGGQPIKSINWIG